MSMKNALSIFSNTQSIEQMIFFFSKSDRMTRAFDIPINKEKQ